MQLYINSLSLIVIDYNNIHVYGNQCYGCLISMCTTVGNGYLGKPLQVQRGSKVGMS